MLYPQDIHPGLCTWRAWEPRLGQLEVYWGGEALHGGLWWVVTFRAFPGHLLRHDKSVSPSLLMPLASSKPSAARSSPGASHCAPRAAARALLEDAPWLQQLPSPIPPLEPPRYRCQDKEHYKLTINRGRKREAATE